MLQVPWSFFKDTQFFTLDKGKYSKEQQFGSVNLVFKIHLKT